MTSSSPTVVIFVGPTLPIADARARLDAIYLPPVGQADLTSAVCKYRPDAIGIIDGVFLQSLSVWHKEILHALDAGVVVYGAASMGALRAAETAEYGTIGVGDIYRMYADGTLTDDDEVAVSHLEWEGDFRPVSEAMVNIRATIRAAQGAGVVDEPTAEALIGGAKKAYFPTRCYPALLEAAARLLPAPAVDDLRRFIAERRVDVKRRDALALLDRIRADAIGGFKRADPFPFAASALFQGLYNRDRHVPCEGCDVALASISNYFAVNAPEFAEVNDSALNRAIAVIFARVLHVTPDPEAERREARGWRLRHGLEDEGRFRAWLDSNHVQVSEWQGLMHDQAHVRALQRWLLAQSWIDKNAKLVLDELRLRDTYEEWAGRAALNERLAAVAAATFEEPEGEMSLIDLLQHQLQETGISIDRPVNAWAEEAGFQTVEDLRIELLRSRAARAVLDLLGTETTSAQ